MMFSQMATSKFFDDKVDLFIACAPIAYMGHQEEEAAKHGASVWKYIFASTKILGAYEINDSFLHTFKVFCTEQKELCDYFFHAIHGGSKYSDPKALTLQQRIGMLSASIKQLAHYAQLIDSGKFAKFDYQWWENPRHYGTWSVPEFDLSKIN